MHKIDDFKSLFSFGIASILVPMAYIIRSFIFDSKPNVLHKYETLNYVVRNELLFSIAITIIFIFGISISKYAASKIVKNRLIRDLILGSSSVEGYWYLKTFAKNGDSPLSRDGIAYMSYKLDSREFKIETTRYDGLRKYITQSEVGYIRTSGSTIRYLNFFKNTYPDPDGPSGFASGQFSFGSHFFKKPQSFEAIIAIQDGSFIGRQSAERIPLKKIKNYYKKHGANWMLAILEEKNCDNWNFKDSTPILTPSSEAELSDFNKLRT